MRFVQKLERKLGRYAIKNLMTYVTMVYVIGWLIQITNESFYYDKLALDIGQVLHGEVWRLLTFIIMPPAYTNMIFMIFTLYLYYMIGTSLERVWGAFRFNLYFGMGIIFHIIAAFIIYFVFGDFGSAFYTTYYLNMSLFFAFAMNFPDMELLLFFILPIKIKWIAMVYGLYYGFTIFSGYFVWIDAIPESAREQVARVALNLGIYPHPIIATVAFVSLLNFIIFFLLTRNYRRISPAEISRKRKYKKAVERSRDRSDGRLLHKCAICGRSNKTNPELSFRYCSKCNGSYEYCEEHLFTHQHIQ